MESTYDYSYTVEPTTTEAAAGFAVFSGIYSLVWLAILVLMIVSMWKIFTKAGKPGWAAIVPIYNIIVMLEIIGKPVWWIFLMLIPFVNFVVAIIVYIELAKVFGKGTGFGILMIFFAPIMMPILAFGSAEYKAPAAEVK